MHYPPQDPGPEEPQLSWIEWYSSLTREEWIAYCEEGRKRARKRLHALPEDKGIPVPHTGKRRWHSSKDSGKTGVVGSSRVLPHRYMDEGDKGKAHNRHIKRLERAQWLSEALAELDEEEWEEYDWTDYLRLTDPQDYVWNDDDEEDNWDYQGCGDPNCQYWGC